MESESVMGTSELHIPNVSDDNRRTIDFNEALPEEVSWETGNNRNWSNVTATCIHTQGMASELDATLDTTFYATLDTTLDATLDTT